MRCPKCGKDNPPEALFCEECDWRLDVGYRAPKKRNPMVFAGIAFVIGIVAIALCFVDGAAIARLIVGALGLVFGSYSVNLPRYLEDSNKTVCMAVAGVGMVLSVFGFIYGLVVYAGVF